MDTARILLNGDSIGGESRARSNTKSKSTSAIYKNLKIGTPVGTPSVQHKKIVAAVRAAMESNEKSK